MTTMKNSFKFLHLIYLKYVAKTCGYFGKATKLSDCPSSPFSAP